MGSPGKLVEREGSGPCAGSAELVLASGKGCHGGRSSVRKLSLTGRYKFTVVTFPPYCGMKIKMKRKGK